MTSRILVVSSDIVFRRAVGVCLANLQHETCLAGSIDDAVAISRRFVPAVLVTDNSVDHLHDGIRLARDLKQRLAHLRCIVTSDDSCSAAGEQPQLPNEAVAVDTRDWIRVFRRPFSMIQFVNAVADAANQAGLPLQTGACQVAEQSSLNVSSIARTATAG